MKTIITALTLATLAAHAAQVQLVVGRASKPVDSQLADGEKFTTGVKSKSHVALNKGFFRVGSDTGVQVVTSNHLSLEKGIMLAGSDPGRFRRPSVTVQAPGYKMEVRGTAQIAYYPGRYVKITVLEGKVRVALQSLTGEAETLEPGQMLIINPSDKRLPDPVEVDIGRLASTSQLLGGAFGELSTQGLIDAAAAAQGAGYLAGDLAATPFRLGGASPDVGLALGNRTAPATTGPNGLLPDEVSIFKAVNDLIDPNAVVTRAEWMDGHPQATVGPVGGSPALEINRTGQTSQARAKTWAVLLDGAGGAAQLYGTITADPAMFAGTPRKLAFESPASAVEVIAGADVSSPAGVALEVNALGLSIDQAKLTAGGGNKPGEDLSLGSIADKDISVTDSTLKGNNVTITNAATNAPTTIPRISLNKATVTAQTNISLGTSYARSTIVIENSSQLAALVGHITVQSKGGAITVDASRLEAIKGTLTLDSTDTANGSASGIITLRDAALNADVIRVRATSPSGDALIISGGTYDASSLIKLYASGTSTIHFTGSTTLTAPLVIIAGGTVLVDPSRTVDIHGEGRIYTDNARFNDGNNGTIRANNVISPEGYAAHPRF